MYTDAFILEMGYKNFEFTNWLVLRDEGVFACWLSCHSELRTGLAHGGNNVLGCLVEPWGGVEDIAMGRQPQGWYGLCTVVWC